MNNSIKRTEIINFFANCDGWDMESLITYVEENLFNHYNEMTNAELKKEILEMGDVNEDYFPFDIEDKNFTIE